MDNSQENNNNNNSNISQANSKELQEQKNNEASQDVVHTVGRGASRYFGGAVGGKVYDVASQTKLGKAIETEAGKNLERNPMTRNATKALHDSGATTAANKMMDLNKGAKSTNKSLNNSSEENKLSNINNLKNNNVPKNINDTSENIDLDNMTDEEREEYLKQQEELERQRLEEEQKEQEIKKAKKKQNAKATLKIFMKHPVVAAIVLGFVALLILLIFWYFLQSMDFDFVGDEGVSYESADNVTGYCQQIYLIKEHDLYPGNDIIANIDDVDLEETFTLNKQQVKRWEAKPYMLEEYTKGVVEAEAQGVDDELTYEIASIVARTYTVQIASSKCYIWDNTNKKGSYRNPQNFKENYSDPKIASAVGTTNGLILYNKNGIVDMSIQSYYDYFCYDKKTREDEDIYTYYKMQQENDEEHLLIPVEWTLEDKNVKGKNADNWKFSGKYDGQCQPNGLSLFGTKYLLNKETDPYTKARIVRYYYGYDVVFKKIVTSYYGIGSCGDFNMLSTTLTKDEFIALLNQYSGGSGFQALRAYAGQIYDMSVANNFNPELVFTRAKVEGYSPGGASNNFYGIGCTNSGGRKACKSYGSVMDGTLAYINLMKSYNVNTLFDVYNVKHYAYIGSHWAAGSSSSGGCYYLPHIAKYYTNQARYATVKNACDSGTGASLPTNSEDQEAYSHFQIQSMLAARKEMFNIDSENCDSSSADVNTILNSDASIGQKAAQLAVAKFDSFGYSQPNRWGDNQVDCSSLVYRTYSMLGINFGGASTSSAELSWCKSNNRMISESQLQPGDLLFKPGHVEIYIGNGRRFGAHTNVNKKWEDQVSVEAYRPGYFTEFCRPY